MTNKTTVERADGPVALTDRLGLVQQLLMLAKTTRALLSLRLAAIGLSVGADELLMSLEDGKGKPITILAEKLSVNSVTVSTHVDRLQALAFVDLLGDDRNSRRTVVQITALGLSAKAKVQAIWKQVGVDLTKDLSASDAAALAVQLATANQTLGGHLSRLG